MSTICPGQKTQANGQRLDCSCGYYANVYMSTYVCMSDLISYMCLYWYMQKLHIFTKTLNVITPMLLLFVTMLNLTITIEMLMWKDYVQVCFQDPLIIASSAETMTEV